MRSGDDDAFSFTLYFDDGCWLTALKMGRSGDDDVFFFYTIVSKLRVCNEGEVRTYEV